MRKEKGEVEMKSKLFGCIIIAMLLSMPIALATDAPWPPEESHDGDSMWVEPASIVLSTANPEHTIGYKFNVTLFLNITEGTDVFQYQIGLHYPKAYFECLSAAFTAPPTSEFFAGHVSTPLIVIDTSFLGDGSILVTEALSGTDMVSGPHVGSLIWAEFNVTAVPPKGGTFSDYVDISTEAPANTWVWDPLAADVLDYTYDASYTFNWDYPPNTRLAVDPELTEFGPWPPSAIGEVFDVTVYIDDLNAAWDLTNATFTLSYNATVIDVIGAEANVTIDALWTGANTKTVTPGVPYNTIDVFVQNPSSTPSGDVDIATIRFTVLLQEESPPKPLAWFDMSPLDLSGTLLYDHEMAIPQNSPVNGEVYVYSLRTLPLARLEVDPPELNFGPCTLGDTFQIDVVVKDLSEFWYIIGFQFRVLYDIEYLDAIDVEFGSFMSDPAWNLYGTERISFIEYDLAFDSWNVVVGEFLLPNATGEYDQTEFPHTEEAVLATITFEITWIPYTCEPDELELDLTVYGFWPWDGAEAFVDRNGAYVPSDWENYVHGKVIIDTYLSQIGRVIDVYTQYPAPYGGQGFNESSDMFWPQKEVILCANVTYNKWPVQHKPVTFTVKDNSGYIWAILESYTNEAGVACVSFRIPWPCENPEQYFGVWTVRADVDIACEIVQDWVRFHYDYLINIIDVSTDAYYYEHCNDVKVTVTFTSHAQQTRHVAIRVTIFDELNVPIATQELVFDIGGAEYCTAEEYTKEFIVHIEKFAYAGCATVHVVPLMHWNCLWCAAGPSADAPIFILPS